MQNFTLVLGGATHFCSKWAIEKLFQNFGPKHRSGVLALEPPNALLWGVVGQESGQQDLVPSRPNEAH